MKTRSQKQEEQVLQMESHTNSSSSLSSCPPSAQVNKKIIDKKQDKLDFFQALQMLQKSHQDSGYLKKSLQQIHNTFIKEMQEHKAKLKHTEDDEKSHSKHSFQICHQKQIIDAEKPKQIRGNHQLQSQNIAFHQKQSRANSERQDTQNLIVRLKQKSSGFQPSPQLSLQQKQNPLLQQQTQQQEQVLEIVSEETFHRSFSSLTKEKQQILNKIKIIQPYLRATIQVLSAKFRAPHSIELEYFWDLDHHRLWLTRKQAKQQLFSFYLKSCTKESKNFFQLNGIQLINFQLNPSLLLNRLKKVFIKILVQKIKIFEALRKKVMQDIRVCNSQAMSQRIPSLTKPWSKKKTMKHSVQNEAMSALEETLRLTQKYLMKNKSGGSVINIIAPSINIIDKIPEKMIKKDYIDGLNQSQALDDKRELQSWFEKNIQVKEENTETEQQPQYFSYP